MAAPSGLIGRSGAGGGLADTDRGSPLPLPHEAPGSSTGTITKGQRMWRGMEPRVLLPPQPGGEAVVTERWDVWPGCPSVSRKDETEPEQGQGGCGRAL